MAQYVTLPDGSSFPIKEGESPTDALLEAQKLYPDAFGLKPPEEAKKKSGLLADIQRGARAMASSEQTGLASLLGGNEAAQAGLERQKQIASEYEPNAGWEEVKKKYEKDGLLSAAGEYLRQVPHAIAEQTPQIAQSMAAARAGAATPIPGGALAGAFAPSFVQQYGGFLEQQAEEQQAKGEPVDVSRIKAAAAAVPAAMIDVAEMYIPMGKGIVKTLFPGAEKLLAKGMTKEAEMVAARKLADEGFLKSFAMGTAKGAALEPTGEVLQDMIGRLQAGQPLFSNDAVEGYGQTAYRTMQMGPLGALGRMQEKSEARSAVAAQKAEDELKAADAAKAAEEAAKTAPDRQLAELEAQTANQPTAAKALPSDIPEAQPYQMANVLNLSDKYQQLQQQLGTLQEQYTQGADIATQQKLETQMEEVQAHMNDLAPAIERMGGSTMSAADLEKAIAASEKKRLNAMTVGNIAAAKKEAAQIQDLTKRLDTARKGATGRGETQNMLLEEPVQPKEQGLQYAAYPKDEEVDLAAKPTKPVEPFSATAAEATPLPQVKQTQQATLQTAQTRVNNAQQQLDKVVKTTGGKNTQALYQAIDAVNQAQDNMSRAHADIGRPSLKPAVIDLFDPANTLRNAIANGDTKVINDIAAHSDRTALRQAMDQNSTDRERLINILESKLNLEGTKRERADLFSKMYNPKQQALFKNGTYPDKALQEVYDQGGPAAVEYENILGSVQELQKKVTTKQGNAKQSLYEQLVSLAAEHEELKAQLESGIAKPTMREKTAKLQAKLGEGEAPAEGRQMDAAERYQAERRLTAIENKYKLVEGKVLPIRDQVQKLWDSMYTTEKAERPSDIAARKKTEANEAAKGPKAKTRSAATAARIERGDVRYEAENSTKMRQLATALGQEEDEYDKFGDKLVKRVQALEAKYGKHDPASIKARIDMAKALEDKAIELGKKTPEYKATLKEQTEIVREALSQSKQTLKSKRTPQVTRKQSGAPKELRVAGSKMSEQEIEAEVKAANKADGGTAYRLGEAKPETTVDAAEAQKVIDGLKLPENVKFVYAPTPGKIPVRLLNMMAKDGVDPTEGMVQGAVFPDGTVLVVGDQHANVKDLEETIAHEIIGHYGIDTIIGHDRLNTFAKKTDVIALAESLGGKPLVNEVMNTVRANADLGRSEEVQKLQALREIIAHTAESKITESFREKAGRWLKELVGMVRAGLRDMGFKNLGELSTSDVFYMLKESRKAFANKTIGPYKAADGSTAFRRRTESSEYGVGRPAGFIDTMLGNMMGLSGRVQFIDQFAALTEAAKKGLEKGIISSLEALNANYLIRFGQQRTQFAGQFLTNGPVKAIHTKKDGGVETVYKSEKGTSMVDVANKLNEANLSNETEQEDMFTLYLAGKRAKQVGWDKLNYSDPDGMRGKHAKLMTKLEANPKAKTAFEEAAKLYKTYNAGLLDFLVDTGALSREKAAELKAIDYVPFYRISGDGEVQLMIDKEHPVRIANIKDQRHLEQLVGGNTEIMPIFTSAAQNTFMLTGMGLRNQAVKETSFMLQKLGIASRVAEGNGPQGENVVRFFKNGKPYHAVIDKDQFGVPAELIVKGMEGVKTSLPALVKAMGVPSQILRSFVVRNPAYAVRQVIRDPLNAWLTTGTDATPILSSMKELAHMVAGRSEAETKLMEAGAISSNVYAGDERDMGKFLKDVSAGRSGWDKALARLDTFALQGDAATRAVIYKDSLDKGMSEQEALLRTLESMNFSRRGVSPSMQWLSTMIPFFNAQIQGLDVLYRAYKGDMPASEQLKIKEKMIQRGLMMSAMTIAYAAMMQDDEAYKRARPTERYSNWFLRVPGFDDPVRVPIPFEMGFLFKALPEAVMNVAAQDEDAGKAIKGLASVLSQTIPNPVPQALKPGVEAVLGKSFYGGDIESAREKETRAEDRYRDNTTELSKLIGGVTGKVGVSPIMLDHLIRGYTSGLGIAVIQLANPILASDSREVARPSTKPSQLPFVGGLFQPAEGRGTLDEAYDRMNEIRQIKGSYNKLIEEGKRAEAKEFAQNYAHDLAQASMSGSVQKRLGEWAKQERRVKADPNMTTEQKDARLAQLDKMKMQLARQFLAQR